MVFDLRVSRRAVANLKQSHLHTEVSNMRSPKKKQNKKSGYGGNYFCSWTTRGVSIKINEKCSVFTYTHTHHSGGFNSHSPFVELFVLVEAKEQD